jgi:hypothetical protein
MINMETQGTLLGDTSASDPSLQAAISAMLDADLAALPDSALEAELLNALAAQRRLMVATSRLADAWQQRGAWADDGSLSAAARLCTAPARRTGRSSWMACSTPLPASSSPTSSTV